MVYYLVGFWDFVSWNVYGGMAACNMYQRFGMYICNSGPDAPYYETLFCLHYTTYNTKFNMCMTVSDGKIFANCKFDKTKKHISCG